MTIWYRDGNYYLPKKYDLEHKRSLDEAGVPENRRIRNNVYFIKRNPMAVGTVKCIEVIRYMDNKIYIRFTASYVKKKEFYNVFERLIKAEKTYYPSEEKTEIQIELTEKTLKELQNVFKYFNQEVIEFSSALIEDFRQILSYSSNKIKKGTDIYQHVIAENGIIDTFTNPEREQSDELLIHLYNSEKNFSQTEFDKCLVRGDDPNNVKYGESTLILILSFYKTNIPVIRLMTYGAKIFLTKYYETVFEKVKKQCDDYPENGLEKSILDERYKIFFDPFSQPAKSLSDPTLTKKSFKVKTIEYMSNQNEFIRSIEFTNNEILTTSLKASMCLSHQEKEDLFTFYSAVFNKADSSRSKEKLRNIFEDDFFGELNLIEFILKGKKIVGFNVFELMPWIDSESDINNQRLTLHVVYSALHPAYRGSGLIGLLTVGLAFAIYGVNPSVVTSLYCTAISSASFEVLQYYNYFPKYKTPKLIKNVNQISKKIYGDKVKIVDDETMKSYVVENVGVTDAYKKPSQQNFMSKLYYAIIGVENEQKDKNFHQESRGARLFLFADDKNFIILCSMLSTTLGYDFRRYFLEISEKLEPLINNILASYICSVSEDKCSNKLVSSSASEKIPNQRTVYFFDSKSLYWKNKQKKIIPQSICNDEASPLRYSRL